MIAVIGERLRILHQNAVSAFARIGIAVNVLHHIDMLVNLPTRIVQAKQPVVEILFPAVLHVHAIDLQIAIE